MSEPTNGRRLRSHGPPPDPDPDPPNDGSGDNPSSDEERKSDLEEETEEEDDEVQGSQGNRGENESDQGAGNTVTNPQANPDSSSKNDNPPSAHRGAENPSTDEPELIWITRAEQDELEYLRNEKEEREARERQERDARVLTFFRTFNEGTRARQNLNAPKDRQITYFEKY